MLQQVKKSLLVEANQSPNLLADLAGLETYIAESYDARSFIELMQNADDAGANRFHAEHFGGILIVANDGNCFSQSDFESLCRSSASRKCRGETIGYRGIGFKSVVGVASRVHLISGGLEVTFCRKMTSAEVPSAIKVPLIRIPHELNLRNAIDVESKVRSLLNAGYQTIFIFEDLVARAITMEFSSFESSALLFLKNITEAKLIGCKSQNVVAETNKHSAGCRHVFVKDDESCRQWVVYEKKGISLAAVIEDDVAVALPIADAVVHAFLPTHEKSGLGAKVNGDFSTDPSRTKVVLDERSNRCTKQVAEFLLDLVAQCIESIDLNTIAPLVPQDDIRMAEFERPSFKKSLFAELQKQGKQRFSNLLLRPKWFESFHDFLRIANASGLDVLPVEFEKIDGLSRFLKALGSREARLKELDAVLKRVDISANGAVEIAARVAELESSNQLEVDFRDWKMWSKEGRVMSTNELENDLGPIENTTLLAEKLGGEQPLRRFLNRTLGGESSKIVFSSDTDVSPLEAVASNMKTSFLEDRIAGIGLKNQVTDSQKNAYDSANSVTKWRSAEIQVMQYLESQGWQVTDVSKRNVGYDLEAISPDAETFFFEAKSLSRVGELFSFTTNEEVVARQYGKNYILALVHITCTHFEIDMIPDPAKHLSFVRQCKQWAWVCENYPFNPHRVTYEKE